MIKTPQIPTMSVKQKSEELKGKKGIQDAVRDVQQILALSENVSELKPNHEYWVKVLQHLDPNGTFSIKRL